MKNLYKAALLAALGLATVSAAQAETYNAGDLLVGFTTASGNDLIIDIGQESALFSGESFSGVSALLTSTYGANLDGVSWGVIGNGPNSGTVRTAWTTTSPGSVPATITGNAAFGKLNTAANALASDFSTSGAIASGQSATPAATLANSWNTETLNGTLTTDYVNAYENPNVLGAGQADFSSVLNNASAPTLLGDFTLGADDSFTFSAVPEPTSYGMLAGAGLLVVSLRNRFVSKKA